MDESNRTINGIIMKTMLWLKDERNLIDLKELTGSILMKKEKC